MMPSCSSSRSSSLIGGRGLILKLGAPDKGSLFFWRFFWGCSSGALAATVWWKASPGGSFLGAVFFAQAPLGPLVLGVAACGSSFLSCAGEIAEILLVLSVVVEVFPCCYLLAGVDERQFLRGGWTSPSLSS